MERWYIAFRTIGSPVDLTSQLGRLVRQYHLGDFVTRACYEKRSGNKRQGEYYFFIGVVSEEKGTMPNEVYNSFNRLLGQLKLRDIGAYVYYDEIQTMASKEIEAFNFRQIKMVHLSKYQPTDPFHYTEPTLYQEQQTNETNPAFNQLLFWLSAYGRGTWQQFRATCTELRIDSTGEYSRRISRRLRSLGHVEMTNDGQSWIVAPACLVQIEHSDNQYHTFLAGQRSPHILESLYREAQLTLEAQPYGNAPEIVRAVFANENIAAQFARDCSQQNHPLYLAGFAGIKIASMLPDLDIWEAQLPVLPIVKGNYNYQQWVDGKFQAIPLPKETGLYQLIHISERFEHPQLTLFYDAEKDIWRKADWYGLRYLMFRRTDFTCEAYHDDERQALSVSLAQRWPELYERALVLASGRLPTIRNNHAFFSNISASLAHLLTSKLGAHLIEYRGI